MEYFKAVTDLSRYADGAVVAAANKAHKGMGDNAATFTAPPITMAAFATDITDYEAKLAESLKGGTDRTTLKNAARAKVEDDFYQLGTYANLVAKGDKSILDLGGFDSYSTTRTQSSGGVDFVPQNARWEPGTVSGAAVLRWKGDGTRAMYEVQTCTSDPMSEANWHYRGSFTGGRAELDSFTPGAIVWGRVRKIGTGGEVGNWSDPAQIRVN